MRSFLVRHWFLLALTLAVGSTLFFPGTIKPLTDHWEPRLTMGLSLLLMAWTMPTQAILAEFRQPYASLWALTLSYGLVPACAWLIGLMLANEDLRLGLILISAVPCTLSSAILWTRLAGGNEATALLTTMGTTVTSWLLTTAWLYGLTGIEPEPVGRDLIITLIFPVFVGQALRAVPLLARIAERHKVLISAMAQSCVVAIVLRAGVTVGMSLQAQNAAGVPQVLALGVILAVGLHLFALLSGLFTCRWMGFDRGRQIAVGFSASQKTLQVSLVLYDQYYSAHTFAVIPLLFYHVGQLLLDTVIARQLQKGGTSPAATQTPALE